MSLFDSIFPEYDKYILEDNTGDDDEEDQNDNPDDYDMNNADGDEDNQDIPPEQPPEDNPPPDAGAEQPADDGGGEEQPQDDNPDDYDMNNADGDEEGAPEPQSDDTPPSDTGEEGGGEEQPQDDNPDDYDMNNANDDGGEGEGDQGEGGEEEPQDDNPDDYDMNNTGGDEGEGGEDSSDYDDGDASQDPNAQPGDYQEPSSKLQDLQKSIFDQLSPEQQDLKIRELKSLYNDVYDKCSKILDIVVAAEKVPAQTKVYDYITNTITDLQKYIRDYLENIFDSKTYIENMNELQKYMAILDTVNNVFEELKRHNEKEFKD